MKPTQLILYYIFKGFTLLFAFLPRRISYLLGRLMGRLVFRFLSERKKITVDNLHKAFPQKNIQWCYMTALGVFENFGRNLVELVKYSAGFLFDEVEAAGIEKVDKGKLLVMGHLGNWEITGILVAAEGRSLYPIGKRLHNPAGDRIINELRTAYGGHHIYYRGGMKRVLRKLRQKKNICVLVDQKIKSGLPVLFFDRPVWATHIVSVLYRKTDVDIVFGYSRHEDDRLRVSYEDPFPLVRKGDSLRADFINTQNQLRWLQEKITEKPDEWFWAHNFWKSRKRGWKTVFLDRDGTLNVDRGYMVKKDQLEFFPGVFDSLRSLRKEGYLLVIVTNQSGIARGYYSEADYRKFNRHFLDRLFEEGVIIDRVYHCPHHPDEGCRCRKPETGMIHRAVDELQIDVSESFMVGDKDSDILAGKRAGLKTIALGEGSFDESSPDFHLPGISEAAQVILEKS